MLFSIKWLERKAPDWIVATITEGASQGTPQEYKDVSINRIDKKTNQVAFANFDELRPGGEIEGEIWQSPKGGWYLFPPRKPKTPQGGAFKSKVIEEAQTRKREDISHFQSTKEEAIKLASAQRDAVLIVTTLIDESKVEYTGDIKADIIKWRNWFLSDEFTKNIPPF